MGGDVVDRKPGKPSCFVILDKDVFLNTPGEYFIRGKVVFSPGYSPKDSSSFVFLPFREKLATKNVLLASEIVTVRNSYIPIRVCVCDGETVRLRRLTSLGNLEILNDVYFEHMDTKDLFNVELNGIQNKINFELEHLPEDERKLMDDLLDEYKDIFSVHKWDIGKTNVVRHKINTGESAPIALPTRRVPIALEEKVDKLVETLLEHDIIEPSESPFNAPIVVVTKKDGDIRLCIDYRRLNSVTVRPIFPIPETQSILDCLSGSMYFSTLDLSSGYYQIEMDKDDAKKTAFATRKGQYQFRRMPFGLCSAPATFQKMMNIILRNENWQKCLIYLDDVLIYGRNTDEHISRLRSVFQRIREAGLKLSPGKCQFMKTEVKFLGHIISKDGILTDPEKN